MIDYILLPHERRLLKHLIDYLPNVTAGLAKTHLGYRQVHERLGLAMVAETYGRSLQVHGLENIARWAVQENAPAITGLVIDTKAGWPADGFFRVHSRRPQDFQFWIDQTTAAQSFDWRALLAEVSIAEAKTSATSLAGSGEDWAIQIAWPAGEVELLDLCPVTAIETSVVSEILSKNSPTPVSAIVYRAKARYSNQNDRGQYDIEYVQQYQTDPRAIRRGRFGRAQVVFDENGGSAEWFDGRGAGFNERALSVEVVDRAKPSSSADTIVNDVSFTRFLASFDCRLRIGWYWSAASDDKKRVIFTIWADQIQDGKYTLLPDEDVYWKWLPGAYEMRRHFPLAIAKDAEVYGVLCYATDESAATRKRKYYNQHELVQLRIERVGDGWIAQLGNLVDVMQLQTGVVMPIVGDANDDLAPPPGTIAPEIVQTGPSTRILRDAMVRNYVLQRAKGKCESCLAVGFAMDDGRVYLECHHIQGLAAGGSDTIENVIALCPNDHRLAHYGRDRVELNADMLRIVAAQNKIRALEKAQKRGSR